MIAFNSSSASETVAQQVPERYWNEALHTPVNEFLQRPGKRIRADLVEMAYGVSGGQGQVPEQLLSFVELLHAGSLIVDDVQDEALMRRGRPTHHRTFGMPLAINTGNWMYFAALEKLVDLPLGLARQATVMRRVLRTVRRCHEGQALDLATRIDAIKQQDVLALTRSISKLKTGGLVSLAAWLGSTAAAAKEDTRSALRKYGMRLGVALQMQNDLKELKLCALEQEPSQDLSNARVTWPWAWAAEIAKPNDFSSLQQTKELAPLSVKLFDLVGPIGAAIVKSRLRFALDELRRALGGVATQDPNQRILDRLESYHV